MNVCKYLPLIMVWSMTQLCTYAEEITYPDLVYRLVDMEQLSLLPQRGERNAMWSSWDRASVYDEKAGKYMNWGKNGDGRNVIREENGQLVLAELAQN